MRRPAFRRPILVLLPFLLTGLIDSAAAAGAVPLDIAGFHPGMTFDEVTTKLQAITPELEVKVTGMVMPELGPDPAPWLITGETVEQSGQPSTIERFTMTVTMPPSAPALWGLSHSQHYIEAEQPAVADVVDALHEKFGKESLSFGLKQFYWGWDETGAQMPDKLMRQCAAYVGINRMMNTQSTVNIAYPVPPQQAACPNGKYVMATIVPGSNPEVATDVEVDFVDSAMDIAAMAATREARLKAQNQSSADQVARAKKNKPKL